MKSKLNDAQLLAESYASMYRRKEEDYEMAAAMDQEEMAHDGHGHEEPMVAVVDIPEPAEENAPDESEMNMAMAELYKIEKYAGKLAELLQGVPSLEGWTAAKITKAADYLGSVYHKLDFDMNGHSMHNTGHEDAHMSSPCGAPEDGE